MLRSRKKTPPRQASPKLKPEPPQQDQQQRPAQGDQRIQRSRTAPPNNNGSAWSRPHTKSQPPPTRPHSQANPKASGKGIKGNLRHRTPSLKLHSDSQPATCAHLPPEVTCSKDLLSERGALERRSGAGAGRQRSGAGAGRQRSGMRNIAAGTARKSHCAYLNSPFFLENALNSYAFNQCVPRVVQLP